MPKGLASTIDDFVVRARALHGPKYDYSQVHYVNAKTKVIIVCPDHGPWEQTPSNHLHPKKYGCKECGKEVARDFFLKTHDEIMERFTSRWGDRFDYSKTVYTDYKTKVTIGCPIHGDFEIHAHVHHQSKHGCYKCSRESHPGKYSTRFFEKNPDKKEIDGIFYIIDLGTHLKIGISKNSFKSRHGDRTPKQIVRTTLNTAFLIENELKQKLHGQYIDETISGKTECFTKSVENSKTIQLVLQQHGFEYEN